tara:strand:- start:398 stop:526 length:129 start_codon:yes stop_codon:yes gene_type:complete
MNKGLGISTPGEGYDDISKEGGVEEKWGVDDGGRVGRRADFS